MQAINPKWYVEQELLIGGWSQEEVRRAMDTQNDATDEVLSIADKNIERIMSGKEPKEARNATTGYLQRIHTFMQDNEKLTPEQLMALQTHFDAHVPIAEENKMRQTAGVAGQNPDELISNQTQNATGQIDPTTQQVPVTRGQTTAGGMGAGMPATPTGI